MWGGNASTVDILVKPDARDKVRKALDAENIKYDITIQDLQSAIDDENPPVEDEDFDNRNGKYLYIFIMQ